MSNYLQTRVCEIEDKDILQLLMELNSVTGVSFVTFRENKESRLIQYLSQCITPSPIEGGPITPKRLNAVDPFNAFLLRKKIGKLHETQIYQLCHDITGLKGGSVEDYLGHTLYVFLNRKFKEKKIKRKPKRRMR